MIVVYVSHLVL